MAPPGTEPESSVSLPQPEPSDSAEVARSLKLAHMLWEEGQQREAVRALQRGATAAEEDGNDLRALTLARSAADLAAHLPASVPPPGASVPPPGASVPPGPASVPPPGAGSMASSPAAAETESEPLIVTVEEPPPSSSPEVVVPILVSPAPPETAPVAPAPMPGFPVPSAAPSAAQPPSVRPSSPVSTPRPSTPSPPRVAPGGRVNTPSGAPAEKHPSKAPNGTNGASTVTFPVTAREVRVSVKRSALDASLLVVRPLAPGAKPPAGCREATLVFSDVDGD